MSLSRKIAKFVAATLFTTFLALFILLLPLHDLTSLSTIKSLSKSQFSEQLKQIEDACSISPNTEFNMQNRTFTCSDIGELDSVVDELIYQEYNKKYSCPPLDCIKQQSFLRSSQANSLVVSAMYASAILAVIFGVITVLLLEKKIKGLGISLIFVGTNYFALLFLKSGIPQTGVDAVDALISSLFAGMMTNFLYILIAGIALTIIGFVTKK